MIWNIKVWQTCKKIKNQDRGQHFFTPLYVLQKKATLETYGALMKCFMKETHQSRFRSRLLFFFTSFSRSFITLYFHWNPWQALAAFCLQNASLQKPETAVAAEVFSIQQGNQVLHMQKVGDVSWNANNLPVWFLLKMGQRGVFWKDCVFI